MALWTPAEISTALWLDASDSATLFDATSGGSLPADGSTIARWEDKSGNARHAIQGAAGSRPTRKTAIQNSLDIVRFDGTTDTISGTSPPIASTTDQVMWITLAKSNLSATLQRIFTIAGDVATNSPEQFFHRFNTTNKLQTFARGSAAESYSVDSTSDAITGFRMFTSRVNDVAGRVESAVNGEVFTQANKGSALISGTHIRYEIGAITGNTGSVQFLNGDLCEVVCVASTSTTTRQLIEGYMAWKWGINSSLPVDHPYYSAAPTVGRARRLINDGLFNRGLFNTGLMR